MRLLQIHKKHYDLETDEKHDKSESNPKNSVHRHNRLLTLISRECAPSTSGGQAPNFRWFCSGFVPFGALSISAQI